MEQYQPAESTDLEDGRQRYDQEAAGYPEIVGEVPITAPSDDTELLQEAAAWEQALSYAPSHVPQVRVRDVADLPRVETLFVQTDTGAIMDSPSLPGQPDREPLLALNVDFEHAFTPAGQVDFGAVYERYRRRTYTPEYAEIVDRQANRIIGQLEQTGIMPDSFVAMPSRKESYTSRAYETVKAGHQDYGLEPFVVVLHNDVEIPSRVTADDLDRIRSDTAGVVLDLHCTSQQTIGEMRALLADSIMEVCSRLGEVRSMVLADADIRSVHGTKGYAALLEPLRKNPNLSGVIGNYFLDPDSVAHDETYALRLRLDRDVEAIIDKYLPPNTGVEHLYVNGACAAINLQRLPALGGMPRVNLGEDYMIGQKLRAFRTGPAPTFAVASIDDFRLGIGAERHAYDHRFSAPAGSDEGGSRYTDWDRSANILRGSDTTHYPLDEAAIVLYVLESLHQLTRGEAGRMLMHLSGREAFRDCTLQLQNTLEETLRQHGITLY